jgi:hypothetical protein
MKLELFSDDIKSTGVEVDLQFTKFLYPTYSHYLESLQSNENMKIHDL